jgi:DNA-binding NarL/FixJ family response regulator
VTEPFRVLIADDSLVYRQGLRAQFETMPGFDIVEATCMQEAVKLALEVKPKVTILDLRIPRSPGVEATYCGIEAIRDIRQGYPGAIIVALTWWPEDKYVPDAIRAGARGYLLKEVDDTDIVALVKAVMCGAAVFSRRIADRMPDLFLAVQEVPNRFPELTSKLMEVALRVARGEKDEAIAKALNLAPKTVKNYISQIFSSLHVKTRSELVVLVRDRLESQGG